MHPGAAAHVLNAEALAPQLLDPFDVGMSHYRMGERAGDRRKNPKIVALRSGAHRRRAAGVADFHFAGNETRHQGRRTAKEYNLCVEAVLREDSLFLGLTAA